MMNKKFFNNKILMNIFKTFVVKIFMIYRKEVFFLERYWRYNNKKIKKIKIKKLLKLYNI